MFARISTFKRSLASLDEGIGLLRDSILPRLEKQSGFEGVMVMVDRVSGVAYAITFWNSEEDLAASKESGKQFAEMAAQLYDLQVEVGNCEVAFSTPLTLGA